MREDNETEEDVETALPGRILNWLVRTKWLRKIEDYEAMTTNIEMCIRDSWNNDLLAFSSGKVAFAFAQPWILIQEIDNHDFDMRICPAPVGPSGDGSMTPAMITNNYMIPVGVEDATSVYCVFEEMMNWYHDDISYRDDPEWFESGFVDEDQVTLANKLDVYKRQGRV